MKKIIGAALGNCVHVAGVLHFLQLAEDEGFETIFLGPAVSPETVIKCVQKERPDYAAVGYRLTPENGAELARSLADGAKALSVQPHWIFGGTRPAAEAVKPLGFFNTVFDGTEGLDECIAFLRTGVVPQLGGVQTWPQDLLTRMRQKRPHPLLRHHFGLPSYTQTLEGIRTIADSGVLDVISLGIDQNTQQFFFHPHQRQAALDGAGGVPVHTAAEFFALREAARRGNFPLMRCYSGTADVLEFSRVLEDTLDNAWCAVPLCWYNELDGRGTRKPEASIRDAQALLRRCGEKNIPAEVNEPHHWGLRDAHDTISVAMSYISAYNAKKCGIKDYISQYMFNIPTGLSFSMDLGKVLAQIELTESLADNSFRTYREVRAGLPFLNADPDVARGQLAASTMLAMNVRPDIIHVVGYSEAERAATPDVVIESCRLVRGVVRSTMEGCADATFDPAVRARKQELLGEARYLLSFIEREYRAFSADPLADANVLADCIRRGILDAPHIRKGTGYRGTLQTRIRNGKCLAYDHSTSAFMTESERLYALTASSCAAAN